MANKKQKFWVRAICIALAAVMVGGVAYLAVTLILSSGNAAFLNIL